MILLVGRILSLEMNCDFLDNLYHEFPNLEWETDENDQIVIWEAEDE